MSQVFLCEQVISYLKQYVSSDAGSKAAAKEVVEAPEPGMKLLKKKDEDEFMFMGSAVKKGKGARKAAEKDKAVDRKSQVGDRGWGGGMGTVSLVCVGPASDAAAALQAADDDEARGSGLVLQL